MTKITKAGKFLVDGLYSKKDVERHKETFAHLGNVAKEAFKVDKAKNDETFDLAVLRNSHDEASLFQHYQKLKISFYVFFVATIICIISACLGIGRGDFLNLFPSVGLGALFLAWTHRYSFRLWQMRNKVLGKHGEYASDLIKNFFP